MEKPPHRHGSGLREAQLRFLIGMKGIQVLDMEQNGLVMVYFSAGVEYTVAD